ELNVSSEALVHLLREMDIPVRSHMSLLSEEHVARLRTVMERERRQGHVSADRAIEAAIEEAQAGPRRRRRRRVEHDETASATADAAEAMAAEAAQEAAERGAELVTTGGAEPQDTTVVVEPGPEPEPVAEPEPPVEVKKPAAEPMRPAAAAPPRPQAP